MKLRPGALLETFQIAQDFLDQESPQGLSEDLEKIIKHYVVFSPDSEAEKTRLHESYEIIDDLIMTIASLIDYNYLEDIGELITIENIDEYYKDHPFEDPEPSVTALWEKFQKKVYKM